MKNVRTVVTALAATALLIAGSGLFACKKKEPETIKVGVILPLTGSLSKYGENSLVAMEIAKDEINSQGGVKNRRIELIIEDSRSDPEEAVTVFKKLVEVHKTSIIVGLVGSSEVLACAPVANETKTVLLSTVGASPKITEAGDYVFRVRVSGTLEVAEIADVAFNDFNLRNVAILYINTDYGLSFKNIFIEEFKRLGGEVYVAEGFDQNETDFRTRLAKIKEIRGLDGVYLPTHITEGATILKQAEEIGLNVQFLASNAIEGPELIQIAGKAAEGVVYTAPWYDPESANPIIRKFDREFFNRTGSHSEMFGAHAYDALKIAVLAIERSDCNPESIKNELYRIRHYEGVTGETTFDENGDVIKLIAVKKVEDGKFVFLEY